MTAPAAPTELRTPTTRAGQRRHQHFGHRPALDGLRGLAVAAVLLFHHGLGWAEGGYLGVSAFFTLSGFLISTLLLGEHARTGRLDLREFWARRFRRLLPAAVAGVLLALAFVLAVGEAATVERFRGDALAALGYVANWRFVLSELSYADLFAGESPLQHTWSLAIEEQFYLVLPLLAALAASRRGARQRLAVIALVGLAASVLVTVLLGDGDRDRLYYGTDTRAAELFVGVFLACLYHQRGRFPARAGPVRTGVGAAALLAMVASWALVDQGTGWLHPWGLVAHAALAGAVILAACDAGPIATVLSLRPLTELGRISYGVYLYHWPLYLWITEERTGLEGPALLAVRLAATLVLSVVSFVLLESPIRHQRVRWPVRGGIVVVGALAAAALVVVAATTIVDREPDVDFAAAEDLADGLRSGAAPDPGPAGPPTTGAPSPPGAEWEPPTDEQTRISIFGDSTALLFVPGLLAWNEVRPDVAMWEGFAALGCGLTRGGERFFERGFEPVPEQCDPAVAWPPVLARSRPHIAIVEIGVWDLTERTLEGDDTVRTLGDPVYDEFLAEEVRAANEVLAAGAERVVWVLQPPPVRGSREDDDPIFERTARFNELLVEVLDEHPQVGFVDVAGWLDSIGRTDDVELRPDGTHFSNETSVVLGEWLGPAVMEAARTGAVVRADDVAPVDLGA